MMKILLFAVLLLPIVVLAQGVYPTTAQSLKPMELGEAILLLMPDKGANSVSWDHRAASNIQWLTEGWQSYPKVNSIFRDGLMRIHVKGKTSTVLKKQKQELAWTVSYSSDENPAFGVKKISISPGVPGLPGKGGEICFGSLYEGCAFAPQPSLNESGIRFKKLCERGVDGSSHVIGPGGVTGFELSHPNRSVSFMRWHQNSGSGGTTNHIELLISPKDGELCKLD